MYPEELQELWTDKDTNFAVTLISAGRFSMAEFILSYPEERFLRSKHIGRKLENQ